MDGKLSERFWISKQVRVDEELGARVRATRAGRSLQGHIAYLLECGLNYIELENRYGKNNLLAHLASHPVMPVSGRDFRHEYPANTETAQDVTARHARNFSRPKPMRRTA